MMYLPIIVIFILSIFSSYLRVNIDKRRTAFLVFKPLTILFIIAFALSIIHDWQSKYVLGVLIALFLSLMGDVFLMLSETKFKHGLFAFFLAHIFYSFAFIQNVYSFNYFVLIGAVLFSSFVLMLLGKSVGKYRVYVMIYVAAITVMLWLAINRYLVFPDNTTLFVMLGAVLFVISDTVLAYKKFKNGNPKLEYIILNSYFAAQLLFTLSLK